MIATKSTTVLEQEHQTIQKVVAKMSLLADRLEAGYAEDARVLRDLSAFLRQFSEECHHVKEEKFLFPLLEARGVPASGCPIAILHHEHEKGHALLQQLDDTIHVFSASGTGRDTLVTTLRSLVTLYVEHIWKENYLLLPMAEKLLSDEDHAALCQHFEALEADLGVGKHRELEQLSERLEVGL
jgi:hemerythrin-like domain-containing protein